MKIKTGLMITLAFANLTRLLIILLQLVSGLSAFALSACTSAFVVHHVFPNPYVPVVAGISLDLAKVTSIFMNRFSQDMGVIRRIRSVFWRGALISIAALFTCIAVSGMLLNKNEGVLLKESQENLKTQFQNMRSDEDNSFISRSKLLQTEMNKERATGIGERYKQLESELSALIKSHEKRISMLNDELEDKLKSAAGSSFKGDRRINDQLFENFKETINENFSVSTTYTGWILVLVIAIAVTIELTIYIIFDNIACSILPYIRSLQQQSKIELQHKLELHRNDMNYERRADDILTEGAIQEMEEAKNAKVVAEKLDTFALKAKKELENEIAKTKKGFETGVFESVNNFFSGISFDEKDKKDEKNKAS